MRAACLAQLSWGHNIKLSTARYLVAGLGCVRKCPGGAPKTPAERVLEHRPKGMPPGRRKIVGPERSFLFVVCVSVVC